MRKWMTVGAAIISAAAVVAAGAALGTAEAQQRPRPSPPAAAECKFDDGKTITVNYSSPQMRGRKIFGELVPYGQVWRLGANEATRLVTPVDVSLGGKTIPAGNYTLHAIPERDKWTLIVSKRAGGWGIPYPGETEDLLRAEIKVSSLSSPVEGFTISFAQAGNSCTMHMDWETTRATAELVRK